MTITKQTVADKIAAYLRHDLCSRSSMAFISSSSFNIANRSSSVVSKNDATCRRGMISVWPLLTG